ncbi:hypothetical protein [Actinacidiphila epipremni]|uniref:Uncharacterized protein n=1 Tax=Actinacidiphila epipremni TaxID=2053013 RepID=A0ABX0ZZ22_9ACTN|nr:hypothetical protein [Actinacidiphila epipremni]NJP48137.1 hypothetical protein [Actinacidiphila epipremni]
MTSAPQRSRALIGARAVHRGPPEAPGPAVPEGGVVDLMPALQVSAGRARGQRGDRDAVHHLGDRRKPAEKNTTSRSNSKHAG